MQEKYVCGICGYEIVDLNSPCPYCGAEPNHFVRADEVDVELIKKSIKKAGQLIKISLANRLFYYKIIKSLCG